MRHLPLIVSALALSACSVGADAGPRTSRDFQVGDFRGVASAGAHDVIVTTGNAPSVRAEGPQEALDRLDIRVEGGTLKIGNKKGSGWSNKGSDDVIVRVTATRVEEVSLAGSGELSLDRAEGEAFKANLAGSGDLKVGSVRASTAEFSLAGSGDLEASGSAGQTKMSLAGSGDLELGAFQTRRAKLSLAGSGDVAAHVTETADVSLAGSGNVRLTGGARCTISKRGSGEVRCN